MTYCDKTIKQGGKTSPIKEVTLAIYKVEVSGEKGIKLTGDFSAVDDESFMEDIENCGKTLPQGLYCISFKGLQTTGWESGNVDDWETFMVISPIQTNGVY